ncbi:MAG TPA: site-2 protease family protein [Ktedonobacterales bacterium]|nr:site-2 protease family protein [Ktedonobacterales bacterium]
MNIVVIVETFLAFAIAVTIHEAAHAGMAGILGDASPAADGRLSLVPRRQMAAVGTIAGIVTSFHGLGALGWGRPVDADARRLRGGANFGTILVAIAGPLINLGVGLGIAFGIRAIPSFNALSARAETCAPATSSAAAFPFGVGMQECLSVAQSPYLIRAEQFLIALAVANIILALVNCIPLHPLDGYKVLYAILPTEQALRFRDFEPYMEVILLIIFFAVPYVAALFGASFSPAGLLIVKANDIVGSIIGPVIRAYPFL